MIIIKKSEKLCIIIKDDILDGTVQIIDVRLIKKDQKIYFIEIYEL